jgi:hypothetical protein
VAKVGKDNGHIAPAKSANDELASLYLSEFLFNQSERGLVRKSVA